MNMDERPIDLTPLDPALDREAWERRVAAIMALAAPELARRTVAGIVGSPALVLLDWFRPALAAAAVLAICAGASLAFLEGPVAAPPEEPAVAAEALRLPTPVALWLEDDQTPSVADLALAMGGGGQP
jgi:hypothetical protein